MYIMCKYIYIPFQIHSWSPISFLQCTIAGELQRRRGGAAREGLVQCDQGTHARRIEVAVSECRSSRNGSSSSSSVTYILSIKISLHVPRSWQSQHEKAFIRPDERQLLILQSIVSLAADHLHVCSLIILLVQYTNRFCHCFALRQTC